MKKKKLLFDILLISLLLCLSLSLFVFFAVNREEGSYVLVEIDGKVVGEYRLDQDAEIEINGGTNTLVIKGGKAFLSSANCPDKTCVKTGSIHYSGESIICLPNKVIIKIKSNSQGFVDLVS